MTIAKSAIYPGTFDPVTLGHLDIIQRASDLLDELIIAVPDIQSAKQPFFPLDLRLAWLKASTRDYSNVRIESFDGLLVDYARAKNIRHFIRGLRSVQDFEYEKQLAGVNEALFPECETFFLMTNARHAHISSSLIREVGRLGGDISSFVPKVVHESLPWH